jgi:hypothetical protein
MRTFLTGLLIPVLAVALLIACGGDDNGTPNETIPDGSTGLDGPTTVIPDSSTKPDASGGADGGMGDGGCNFATFVKGLVANDTNGTALPSTDLGQTCVDDQNQAEFQSLFP